MPQPLVSCFSCYAKRNYWKHLSTWKNWATGSVCQVKLPKPVYSLHDDQHVLPCHSSKQDIFEIRNSQGISFYRLSLIKQLWRLEPSGGSLSEATLGQREIGAMASAGGCTASPATGLWFLSQSNPRMSHLRELRHKEPQLAYSNALILIIHIMKYQFARTLFLQPKIMKLPFIFCVAQ